MNLFKVSFILVALALSNAFAEKFSFEGYKLIRITPKSVQHLETLATWENNQDFDMWSKLKAVDDSVTILLSPAAFGKYKVYFGLLSMPYEIVNENVESIFQEQDRSMVRNGDDRSIVGKYARYTEIQNFIDQTVLDNPSLASSYVAGQTYEKRNLKVIVLKTSTSKRNIWIDCGIHAREWVTPATCVYIINKLVEGYKNNDKTIVSLLSYFEFHILPLQNPDGYEYSQTIYRMWRKNRSPNSGSSCLGTDLNRNWGHKWMTGGSSSSACSDTFAGKHANSELETQAIQNAINKYPGRWDSFLTIHSYGQWWFTNWGYTSDLPPNYNDVMAKAKVGVDAIKSVYGTTFTYGSSARILYIASGGSEDWAYGVAGIPYSYCLELRPGQSGTDANYGFALPEDRAPKAGEETYQGIQAFLVSIKQ